MITELLTRCSFPAPGNSVTCAVSGGADSLALLALARAADLDVTAIHVDHAIRPDSHLDAAVVTRAAIRFGARFELKVAPVELGSNLEARAREARFAVLPNDVLTGHTADDQAETVLLNLLRGAGLDGLAGMTPDRHPILNLRRAETRALCASLGLTPVDDPTNTDPAYRRNRVRHELLPLLDAIADRDVAAIISRQAGGLREDAAFLDDLAQGIDCTDARALAAAPPVLARRAIRCWLRSASIAGGPPAAHPPDAATVDRVLAVARHEAKACDIGGGRRVRRTGGRLVLETP